MGRKRSLYRDEVIDQDWKRKLTPKIRKFLKDYDVTATFSIQPSKSRKDLIAGGFVATLTSGKMYFPESFNGLRLSKTHWLNGAIGVGDAPLPREQFDFLCKLLDLMSSGHRSNTIVQIGKERRAYKHKPWTGTHYPKGVAWIDTK